MKFTLIIMGQPYSCQSVDTSLRFAKAALKAGHEIHRVFFYHDGVNAANTFISPPQDESNLPKQWSQLAKKERLDLVVCIASALKRGVLDQTEAARYNKSSHNLMESFEISGLGQLIEAHAISDRVVSFGP